MSDDNRALKAEDQIHELDRLQVLVAKTFKDLGVDIHPAGWDSIFADLILRERASMRVTASRLVEAASVRCSCESDAAVFERIAYGLLRYVEDSEGNIHVPPEADDADQG